jgi:hypothetical protein
MTTQSDYKIYPVSDPKPFGHPMKEWIQKWWKWLLEIPEEINPSNDFTGSKCSIGQVDPNVWFLAGAHIQRPHHTMATVNRQCDIPGDKAVGIVVAANELSKAEFPHLDDSQLIRYASEGNQLDFVELIIDGSIVQKEDVLGAGITSDLFDVALPEDNIFGAPHGPTKAVGHGYMIIVEGLSGGQSHKIIFTQVTREHVPSRTPTFGYKITYHLNVKS